MRPHGFGKRAPSTQGQTWAAVRKRVTNLDEAEQRLVELIRDAGQGDARAREALVRQVWAIAGVIVARGVAQQDRDEVLGDIAWRVVRGAAGYRGGAKLSTWVWTIAAHRVASYITTKKRRREQPGAKAVTEPRADEAWGLVHGAAPQGPEEAAIATQMGAAIDRALAELTDIERDVFVRRQRQSLREIEAEIGLSDSRVYQIEEDARRKLRRSLEAAGFGAVALALAGRAEKAVALFLAVGLLAALLVGAIAWLGWMGHPSATYGLGAPRDGDASESGATFAEIDGGSDRRSAASSSSGGGVDGERSRFPRTSAVVKQVQARRSVTVDEAWARFDTDDQLNLTLFDDADPRAPRPTTAHVIRIAGSPDSTRLGVELSAFQEGHDSAVDRTMAVPEGADREVAAGRHGSSFWIMLPSWNADRTRAARVGWFVVGRMVDDGLMAGNVYVATMATRNGGPRQQVLVPHSTFHLATRDWIHSHACLRHGDVLVSPIASAWYSDVDALEGVRGLCASRADLCDAIAPQVVRVRDGAAEVPDGVVLLAVVGGATREVCRGPRSCPLEVSSEVGVDASGRVVLIDGQVASRALLLASLDVCAAAADRQVVTFR